MLKEFCDLAPSDRICLGMTDSFIGRAPVAPTPFRYLQLKVMDALAHLFPEGSDLDPIFWSYDDWREARERVFASRAKKLADSAVPKTKN
jgi:hypothetical protein